jgi:hypothetical protein
MWYILSGRFVNPEKTIFPRAYDDENPTVVLTVAASVQPTQECTRVFQKLLGPEKQMKEKSVKRKVTTTT